MAQFLAVEYDSAYPKEQLINQFADLSKPDLASAAEPHNVLADLPLSLYVTTNYDDFMIRALKHKNKDAKQEYCRWNNPSEHTIMDAGFVPSVANPLVYHLHGYAQNIDSLVLTEDDYLDFLVTMSTDAGRRLIPPLIQSALTTSSILFLGYKLADWDFKVLYRTLITYMRRSRYKAHISVQLMPIDEAATIEQKTGALRYLDKYFRKEEIRVYWGTCREFVGELNLRRQDEPVGGAGDAAGS